MKRNLNCVFCFLMQILIPVKCPWKHYSCTQNILWAEKKVILADSEKNYEF